MSTGSDVLEPGPCRVPVVYYIVIGPAVGQNSTVNSCECQRSMPLTLFHLSFFDLIIILSFCPANQNDPCELS